MHNVLNHKESTIYTSAFKADVRNHYGLHDSKWAAFNLKLKSLQKEEVKE